MYKNTLIFIPTIILFSCAQIQPLTGGKKDMSPPKFVNSKINPPNQSTNFNTNKITLFFDEFITLENPNDNIIITPLLNKKPKYKVINKKLIIDLSEVELDKNTTYSFNFNGAIKDYNEGNDSLYKYVFSTGNHIDSLTLSGKIIDGKTNANREKINILLYDEINDSIPYNKHPKYLTQSNNDGSFTFKNLKQGKYKLIALNDLNKNLIYNPFLREEIAFKEEPIEINSSDTIKQNLRLFQEENDKLILEESNYLSSGKLILKWNNSSKNTSIRGLSDTLIFDGNLSNEKESIYWVKNPIKNKLTFSYTNSNILDTISKIKSTDNEKQLGYKTNGNDVISPFDTLFIFGKVPVKKFDTSKIRLFKDTILIQKINYKIKNKKIKLFNKWEANKDYKIILDSGFATTIYDSIINRDTIKFTTRRVDFYGNLILNTTIPFRGFIEILNSENKVIAKLYNPHKIELYNLEPGSYTARFIIDSNQNKKWDTGKLRDKIQPEKIIYFNEKITIRSNWDVELEWIYKK